jgi:predicted ferric reductase
MIAGIWWDFTRASANVAWILILFTIIWGVFLTTRVLRGMDRPAWLRDLHSWMGGLTVCFAAIHMLTLIPDPYVNFEIVNLFVPFTNNYKPLAVSLGVIGFWTLVAIQGTSLMMKKMSRETWRRIHMLSYPLYGIIVVHSLTAGSDVGTRLYTGFSMALAMTGAAIGGVRLVAGRNIDRKKRENRENASAR